MPKANPKAWFTSPIAKITYGSVGKWDVRNFLFRPYFPTWQEAHDWMMAKAAIKLASAERELARAKRHMEKVKAMTDPNKDGGAAKESAQAGV